MPIISFSGLMGSGKSLSMVREAVKYYAAGYKIYANFHLNIPYTHLTFDDLVSMVENEHYLKNCVILLDEVHIMLDSRGSMTKTSKLISFWLNFSRKNSILIMYTTQHLHQVDKRLRSGTDTFVFCEGIKYVKNGKEYFIVVNNISNGNVAKEEFFVGNKFFKYYDTNEVIAFMKKEPIKAGHGDKDDDGSFIPEFADNRKGGSNES